MTNKSNNILVFWTVLFFCTGSFYRFLSAYPPNLRFDPASSALQAFQILDGYRPIFWPGQAFMGSLGSYLIAGLFKIFAPSIFLLNFLGWFLTIFFVFLTIIAAYRLFNLETAFFTSLFFMIPTKTMMYWSSQARPDYEICFILVPLLLIITNSIYLSYKKGVSFNFQVILFGFFSGLGMWNNMAIGPLIVVTFFILMFYLKKHFFKKVLPLYSIFFLAGFAPVIYFNFKNGLILTGQADFKNVLHTGQVIKSFTTNAFPYFFGVKYSTFQGYLWRIPLNLFLIWLVLIYFMFIFKTLNKLRCRSNSFPLFLVSGYLLFHLIISTVSNFGHRFERVSHPTLYITTLYAVAFTIPAFVISTFKSVRFKVIVTLPILIYFAANIYDTRIYTVNFFNALKANGMKDILELPLKNDPFIKFSKEENIKTGYYLGRNKMMQAVKSAGKVIFSDIQKEHYIPYALAVDGGKDIFWANHHGLPDILTPLNLNLSQKMLKEPKISYEKGKRKVHFSPMPVFYNFKKDIIKEELITSYKFKSSSGIPADLFINDNQINTLWRINNKASETPWFQISFNEPMQISKIAIVPENAKSCPKNYTVSISYNDKDYEKLYEISGGIPLFWSTYHPFLKSVKPRAEIHFPNFKPVKAVRFDFPDCENNIKTSIRELLVFKKTSSDLVPSSNYFNEIDEIIRDVKDKYADYLIFADHWLQNRLKIENFNTEFISNITVNNTGRKNPHYKKILPMDFHDKSIIICEKAQSAVIGKALKESNIDFKGTPYQFHDIFLILPQKTDKLLYWNGLSINKASIINSGAFLLSNIYKEANRMNLNFGDKIKLTSHHIQYDPGTKRASIFFEWKPLKHIDDGYFLFIHFINEKDEILFQGDMRLKPGFSPDWIIGAPALTEQYISHSEAHKKNIRIKFGIWHPESGKRLKVNTKEKYHVIMEV